MPESTGTKGIPLLTGDDDYKYLGIMESNKILHEKAKTKAKKEFTKRVREILKKELNGENTADTIRTYAMPILRYGFGIRKWGKGELSSLDRKIQKMLTKGKWHNHKSKIYRLYLSREKGGRGLIGATDCHRQECTALTKYLETKTDRYSEIIRKNEKKKKTGITSYLESPSTGITEEIDEEYRECLRKMELHGNYFKTQNNIPNVDIKLSNQWLTIPLIRNEMESLLCAAKEQALATN